MEFVTGYSLIPVAAVLGLVISYMDGKQNNTEKTFADHAKIAILLAFITGIVIFINSGEAMDFFRGGNKVLSDNTEMMRGGGSSLSSSIKNISSSVTAIPPKSVISETFITGLANF